MSERPLDLAPKARKEWGVTGEDSRKTSEDHGGAEVGTAARSPNLERLRDQLESYMAEQGLRSTEQRRLIIDKFFESAQHLTIDELLGRVRNADPKVGYATVYRTMKMLADGGIANELNFGDNTTRYEVADVDAHHDHLICQECGHIIEFEEPLIEELQERIAARHHFVIKHHKHELYGTCVDPKNCEYRTARDSSRSRESDK